MSNTYRHKKACKAKRKIIEHKLKTYGNMNTHMGISLSQLSDHVLMNLFNEFKQAHSVRHGNKRKYEAEMKTKSRRSQRSKEKQELQRSLNKILKKK